MKIPTLSSVCGYLLSMTISCAFEEKNLFVFLFRQKSMSFESQSEVWAVGGQLCLGDNYVWFFFFSARRNVFNSITFGLLCIWKLRLFCELLRSDYRECVSENQMGSRAIIKRVFTQSTLRTRTEILSLNKPIENGIAYFMLFLPLIK